MRRADNQDTAMVTDDGEAADQAAADDFVQDSNMALTLHAAPLHPPLKPRTSVQGVSAMFESLNKVINGYGLISGFAIIGVTMAVSYWLSARLTPRAPARLGDRDLPRPGAVPTSAASPPAGRKDWWTCP